MMRPLLFFPLLVISVYGSGEFSVLSSPPSITFKGHDYIRQSLLKEVYSASLGLTTEQDSNWQGMYISDPFNLARSVVTVVVDGVSDIGLNKGNHYPLKTDEDESETFNAMQRRIEERYPSGGDNLFRVDLAGGIESIQDVNLLKGVKNVKPPKLVGGPLKLNNQEDGKFLEELAFFNSIIDQLQSAEIKDDGVPDVLWFKVSNLHALSDLHGENSTATKEAKHMILDSIERLNAVSNKLYDNHVLVNVITSDASHTRRVRRAATKEQGKEDELNLSKNYSNDYPVIFNIILWFGVVMIFSLLAISIFIGTMDPGRDSIIYRMTSTRMKKDN